MFVSFLCWNCQCCSLTHWLCFVVCIQAWVEWTLSCFVGTYLHSVSVTLRLWKLQRTLLRLRIVCNACEIVCFTPPAGTHAQWNRQLFQLWVSTTKEGVWGGRGVEAAQNRCRVAVLLWRPRFRHAQKSHSLIFHDLTLNPFCDTEKTQPYKTIKVQKKCVWGPRDGLREVWHMSSRWSRFPNVGTSASCRKWLLQPSSFVPRLPCSAASAGLTRGFVEALSGPWLI